tara:strand:- start:970 stop:2568 length:1599 start_codon:yes stop_codon:yes gene_type:complete
MNTLLFLLPLILILFSITPQVFAEYEDTIVVFETNSGKLIFEFFPDDAPNHVDNFVSLSKDGVYEETIFHRIISGFMVQGGDPNTKDFDVGSASWGTGSPGYTIDAEFNDIKHNRGIVSMARSADPNSAGSQFFIVHEDSHFLDGQYTVFARIISDESFDTLDRLANLETLNSVTGVEGHAEGEQPMKPILATITNVEVLTRSDMPDLPKFEPPQRTHQKPMETGGGKYTNTDYGVSFNTPQGWIIQTPVRVSSDTPNIVVAGPKIGNISPTLTVTISQTTSNLDQNVQEYRKQIQPLIDQNVIMITDEYPVTVDDEDAYVFVATANFENQQDKQMELAFATSLVTKNDKLYILQYMNTQQNFVASAALFNDMINSFKVFSTLSENSEDNISMEEWKEQTSSSEGGGCLIATAAFGSEMAPQVQFLRELRDDKVMTTESGIAFMTIFNQFYYSFSPAVADYERENPVFKEAVRVTLTPMLTSLTLLNYIDVDTEEEMLGYGIGIILLNVGMYFVAPAAAIIAIKNRIMHVRK